MVMKSADDNKHKPKVLTLVGFFTPAYKAGGPIRSIEGIVHHLSEYFDFKIITRDHEYGSSVPFDNVKIDEWQRVGKADVYYASPSQIKSGAFKRLLNRLDYDVLYLNSFVAPRFTIVPLVLRRFGFIKRKPVILAPRGELSSGALRLKYIRKHCYIWLAKLLGLYNDVTWQASSEFEAKNIQVYFPHAKIYRDDLECDKNTSYIRITPNLIVLMEAASEIRKSEKSRDSLRIVFLSRISPMKNLEYALDVVSRVKGKVLFDIYGPVNSEKYANYWEQCKQLIEKMPALMEINYKGEVEQEQVREVFSQYDIFLLPTLGENFGHVIAESLSAGCPVLTSDKTPWRDLKEKHAGWDLPLDQPSAFVKVLQNMMTMGIEEYASLSEAQKHLPWLQQIILKRCDIIGNCSHAP